MQIWFKVACSACFALAVGMGSQESQAGDQAHDVRPQEIELTEYSKLASNAELARRLLSPLTSDLIPARLLLMHKGLREYPVDLENERFFVRVPSAPGANGYAVLVFIPPWETGELPQGWGAVFDRLGIIFISAIRSGNDENALGRREPLAILAAHNLMVHYSVDPARVFIAGFSGGSRVAMRLAIAYPDLFRGAILDAGSDPIGGSQIPLPPRNLFEEFRTESKLIYVTGSLDDVHQQQEAGSVASMRRWCAFNTISRSVPFLGHEPMPPSVMSQALTELLSPVSSLPAPDEACWSRVIEEIDTKLTIVQKLSDGGDTTAARSLLNKIDRQFGGLASPRSLEISRALPRP